MSFARLRERVLSTSTTSTGDTRRLYERIARVGSKPARDELLVMAQRLEQR